jgi:hypothetical protein
LFQVSEVTITFLRRIEAERTKTACLPNDVLTIVLELRFRLLKDTDKSHFHGPTHAKIDVVGFLLYYDLLCSGLLRIGLEIALCIEFKGIRAEVFGCLALFWIRKDTKLGRAGAGVIFFGCVIRFFSFQV